jgi:hypothetical protein
MLIRLVKIDKILINIFFFIKILFFIYLQKLWDYIWQNLALIIKKIKIKQRLKIIKKY